jgi:arylsulfate sulfotransferase
MARKMKGFYMRSSFLLYLFVLCLITAVMGCGSKSLESPQWGPWQPPIDVIITPQQTVIPAGATVQFSATIANDSTGVSWSTTKGIIDADGTYTAPFDSQGETATVTAASRTDPSRFASARVIIVAPGQISRTANSLVALYTISLPAAGNVYVEFGLTQSYELRTWTQSVLKGGGTVRLFVAGMKPNSLYHMRGVVQFADGTRHVDEDQTFTTGSLPLGILPQFTATTTPGMVPQPGIELVNTLTSGRLQATAVDLSGNVVWYYDFTGAGATAVHSIHLTPSGSLLMVLSPGSSVPLTSPTLPSGTICAIREIDLAGNTIREISVDQLNVKLEAAGYDINLGVFHHDVISLPNGHLIVLANTLRQVFGVSGYAGITRVLGDVLVELDTSLNPVWVWNEFDHLDVNRHPMDFPDWTHSNAIAYSADDGNLLVSIRHQSWIVKLDYADGKGNGDILWRLGYEGDFALSGGMDPTDWFSGQHAPSFVGPETTGNFSLAVFDNGNNRMYPLNAPCSTGCDYSTAMVLDIDEAAMTAAIAANKKISYSNWGGNAEVLPNGNLEYNITAAPPDYASSSVYEVTAESGSQTVWQLRVGSSVYRAFRIPSLYPGIQW